MKYVKYFSKKVFFKLKENYLFGRKSLLDAIENKLPIKVVYLLANNLQIINILKENKINYVFKDKNFFNSITNNKNNQFIVFTLAKINTPIPFNELLNKLYANSNSLVLILDEIQDIGNLGAILRSADVFGVDAIIYKKHHQADLLNENVIKTSTNAISYLTICEVVNLNRTIEELKEHQFWIYASCLDEKAQIYSDQEYPNKTCIIVGNENKGVSQLLQKNADVKIYIPQYGHVQSLNVSVATGILLADYKNRKK